METMWALPIKAKLKGEGRAVGFLRADALDVEVDGDETLSRLGPWFVFNPSVIAGGAPEHELT